MLFASRIGRFFREKSRNIFSYFDGERWVKADPLLVGVKLEEVCPDYQELLDTISKDATGAPVGAVRDDLKRQQHEAVMKLDAAARAVFGLKPLPPSSVAVPDGVLSVGEVTGVLARYCNFMRDLAESAELFRDSPATA